MLLSALYEHLLRKQPLIGDLSLPNNLIILLFRGQPWLRLLIPHIWVLQEDILRHILYLYDLVFCLNDFVVNKLMILKPCFLNLGNISFRGVVYDNGVIYMKVGMVQELSAHLDDVDGVCSHSRLLLRWDGRHGGRLV